MKSLFINNSRNVATIRRTSCIRFKWMNTDDYKFLTRGLQGQLLLITNNCQTRGK